MPALEEPPSVEKPLPNPPENVGGFVSDVVLVGKAVPKTVERPGEVPVAGMPDPDACFPNKPYVFAAEDAVLFPNRPALFTGGLVAKAEARGVAVDLSLSKKLNVVACCATGSVVVIGVALAGGRAGVATGEEGVAAAASSHEGVRLRDAQPDELGERLTRSRLAV